VQDTSVRLCAKIDNCYKVDMVLDKDMAGDWQYAETIRSVCALCAENTTLEKWAVGKETMTDKDKGAVKLPYVRLSVMTLYRTPDCYGVKGKPDLLSDACLHCFLKKQCQEKQEVVWR